MRSLNELNYLLIEYVYCIRRYECQGCQIDACSQKRHSCLIDYDENYYEKMALEQMFKDVAISYQEYQYLKSLNEAKKNSVDMLIIDDSSTN